jgi:C4-dicarboxylate-specific signal transduction histidine kinase
LNELKKSIQEDIQSSLQELNRLSKNVDHIKTIITLQQSFASQPQFKEECSAEGLIDDAITLLEGELWVSGVNLTVNRNNKGFLVISKHKMLQVLINLIRNAKEAVGEANNTKKDITITIEANPTRFIIEDNGIGIAEENLSKIFTHGFTTKKLGHGFGLNSCAIAISELGGKITVESNGPNLGAKFVITF